MAWGTASSRQWAELQATTLAIEDAPPRAYIYTDSWALYKGLRTWVTAWEAKDWELAGRPLSGAALWQQLLQYTRRAPLVVRHVDAHTKAQTAEAHWNAAADDMAQGEVMQLAECYHVEGGHHGARATQYTALRQGIPFPLAACRTIRAGCPICSRLAPNALPGPAGRIYRATGPCQDWQVDYIGPLPQEQRWQYPLGKDGPTCCRREKTIRVWPRSPAYRNIACEGSDCPGGCCLPSERMGGAGADCR
uniref:RNase H type-1 domain-containing protein n=1 Tax=Chelydra serpentina TaxID=8475 RepID=A0A8C3SKA5_CHESE